jgi:hypothetical protein
MILTARILLTSNRREPTSDNRRRALFPLRMKKSSLYAFLLFLAMAGPCLGQSKKEMERTEVDNLQNYYATLDEHYARVVAQLTSVQSALTQLSSAVVEAQQTHPDERKGQFSSCLTAIETALRRTRSAIQASEIPQYGNVRALLSVSAEQDENRLAKVSACVADLSSGLRTHAAIADSAARLNLIAESMEEQFAQIDQAKAKRNAKSAYRRVLPEKPGINKSNAVVGSCENIDFEQAGYKVREVRIQDPFVFLPWVKARERRAAAQIAALVKGQPFRYDQASAKALEIIEKENFLPDTSDKRVKLRVEIVKVENCANGELDLAYGVFSTQIMPVLSGTPESRVVERQTPQTAAGQTTVMVPKSKSFHFTPKGGYDSTDLLYGGGRLEITPPGPRRFPFKSFIIDGEGSSKMHDVSVALAGSADFSADSTDASQWLANAEWRLNFTHYALPTGLGQIKGGHLSGQFSGTTKPLGKGNLTLRFGGSLEGGNQQSDLGGVALAPDTVASDGYGSVKLYAGLDSRTDHNVVSASYGLELGSIGPSTRVDWRKHILDVRHELWYSLGDHRILDLESRFTFGSIQVPGKVPLPERFFGGNNEQFFIAGDTWQIRANPVIRAIPGNKFFRTADGAGSKNFLSYNLTAAYALWRETLVPQELTADPEFNSQLTGAITTVTSTLQNYYASKDAHFVKVVSQLPSLRSDVNDLKTVVATSQAAHAGQSPQLFKACTRAVGGALRRLDSAITPQGSDQFGLVTFLLSDDPDEIQLVKVDQACKTTLSVAISDATIATASDKVAQARASMLAEFNLIDQTKAASKAGADLAFTRRTLNTLFNDVNIYSISPVFVFDVAKINSGAGFGGVRYGPGLGVRLELASVAQFTTGYAFNVRRGPGEGFGNVFFSIGIRDLFR